MCGQVGIIFGEKRRGDREMDYLKKVFAYLLLLSEKRGPHATGAAWLDQDGRYDILKSPGKALDFVRTAAFPDFLACVDSTATWLAGHTRWQTRGDASNNRNNHPIRAGYVIGTHNGTITNADYLFAHLGLPRYAEVDSEIIFRVADATLSEGAIDVHAFASRLALCTGQVSAVMAAKTDPHTVFVIKGNKPLELRYSKSHRAIIYASDPVFLNTALAGARGWQSIAVRPMSILRFTCGNLLASDCHSFQLAGQLPPDLDTVELEDTL